MIMIRISFNVRQWLRLCAFTLTLLVMPWAECFPQSIHHIVFPHFAVGEQWESELVLYRQGGEPGWHCLVEAVFYDPNGQFMNISVNGSTPTDRYKVHLDPNSGSTALLTSTGPTRTGYIHVFHNEWYPGGVIGLLKYRFRSGSKVISQVAVPPTVRTQWAQFHYDNTGSTRSALAIGAFHGYDGTYNAITFKRCTENGVPLEVKTLTLRAHTQTALYVHQLFPNSVGSRGFITAYGTMPFGYLALDDTAGVWSSSAAFNGLHERILSLPDGKTWLLSFRMDTADYGFSISGVAIRPGQDPAMVTGSLRTYYAMRTNDMVLTLNVTRLDSANPLDIWSWNICKIVSDLSLTNVTAPAVALSWSGAIKLSGTCTITRPVYSIY